MKVLGIKFFMKDGTVDYYDPLRKSDFKDLKNHYELHMNYLYDIFKEEVIRYEWYNICDDCGYELTKGDCNKCISEAELKSLKEEL